MPIVEPNAGVRVLVSGGNGYIGLWVVRTLLEQGYIVRGAVRSEDKGKHLKKYFESYGDKVEWVVVKDIAKHGAFDEAVKDVEAIEHLASPVIIDTSDPDDYIKPAVDGTVGILRSALKFGLKVKRVIITSSIVAVVSTMTQPGAVFDESHWGESAIKVVNEQGKDAHWTMRYSASKTLAEQAAWDFYNKHRNEVEWDLVTLIPPLVAGPPLQELKSPADLNSSLSIFWDGMTNDKPDDALKSSYVFIDVRDAAAAHVAALRKAEAGGERIIVSRGAKTWQDMRNALYASQPELYSSGILPRGNSQLNNLPVQYDLNPEKGKQILGIEYRSVEEIVRDTLSDFQARGWLPKPVENSVKGVELKL